MGRQNTNNIPAVKITFLVLRKFIRMFLQLNKMSLLSLFLLGIGMTSFAQDDIEVTLGPDEIGANQIWTITVTVRNVALKSYDKFPDLKGFQKRGTSTQSSTNIINGQISSTQSVIMNYLPEKQGTLVIPSFSIKVNGQSIAVKGKKITIGPPVQQQQDPFWNFFDRGRTDEFFGNRKTEYLDIKEDAFFALTSDREEVYAGEGFNVTLSFFVADANRAPLNFFDLSKQLSDIVKAIRPNNCWEENFNIENIEGNSIQIKGKDYTQYKIYQASYFPFNDQPVVFPKVGLKMIKYQVAKNPSAFGQNRKEDYKTFYTKPLTIKIKPLPPHPLRESAAVGQYQLEEKIPSTELKTGQSASYEFSVIGAGNIASLNKPSVEQTDDFEWYEPNIHQDVQRRNNKVSGKKSFAYFVIPKEPGRYSLGDYFQWVYFDPVNEKYDTLKSRLTLYVTGESKKNETILSADLGSYYGNLSQADNTLRAFSKPLWPDFVFYGLLFFFFGGSLFLMLKK